MRLVDKWSPFWFRRMEWEQTGLTSPPAQLWWLIGPVMLGWACWLWGRAKLSLLRPRGCQHTGHVHSHLAADRRKHMWHEKQPTCWVIWMQLHRHTQLYKQAQQRTRASDVAANSSPVQADHSQMISRPDFWANITDEVWGSTRSTDHCAAQMWN